VFRSLLAVAGVTAAALAAAPAAAADQATYLRLQTKLNFLTAEQLLTEGHRACQASRSGMGSSDIVGMVYRDLRPQGISISGATDIVSSAIVQLDC
jgi:hypothetical protein